VSTTPNPRRPHGIPLNGQVERIVSIATHAAASHAGHERSRCSTGEIAPRAP
jgi:hypothetical protein